MNKNEHKHWKTVSTLSHTPFTLNCQKRHLTIFKNPLCARKLPQIGALIPSLFFYRQNLELDSISVLYKVQSAFPKVFLLKLGGMMLESQQRHKKCNSCMRKWRRRAIKRQSYELWMKTTTNHQIQRDDWVYLPKKLPNQIGLFFFSQHHRKIVESFFATVSTQTP